jgi:hypothetical protein
MQFQQDSCREGTQRGKAAPKGMEPRISRISRIKNSPSAPTRKRISTEANEGNEGEVLLRFLRFLLFQEICAIRVIRGKNFVKMNDSYTLQRKEHKDKRLWCFFFAIFVLHSNMSESLRFAKIFTADGADGTDWAKAECKMQNSYP